MKTTKLPLLIAGLSLISLQTASFAIDNSPQVYNTMVGSTACATSTAAICLPSNAPNPPVYYRFVMDPSIKFASKGVIETNGGINFPFDSTTSKMLPNLKSTIGSALGGYIWTGDFYQDGYQMVFSLDGNLANSQITINGYTFGSFNVTFDSNDIKKGSATVTFPATYAMGWAGDSQTVTCTLTFTCKRVTQLVGQKFSGTSPLSGQFVNGQVLQIDIKLSAGSSDF